MALSKTPLNQLEPSALPTGSIVSFTGPFGLPMVFFFNRGSHTPCITSQSTIGCPALGACRVPQGASGLACRLLRETGISEVLAAAASREGKNRGNK